MRLLSKRQVKELVLYSYTHTARMEKDGLFPKRVRLNPGLGPRSRVGYIEKEILDWLQRLIDARR